MLSTRHGGGPPLKSLLIALMAVIVLHLHGTPASAFVEGLALGMPLEQIHTHPNEDRTQYRFEAQNVHLDQLPLSRLT